MFVPQPGLIVGNRYSLTQVIGRGGMGEVWRAHDRQLDTPCALKFIVAHLASDRGIRERFSREAKAVARLRSPHVVQILGVGEVDDIPYLAMELLEGETLLARLGRLGRLPALMTLQMIEQVAEALESAHAAGVVHRDLKPDNVWFWSGSKVFVKVLDFGVAKTGLTTESLQTATGALVGTPQYMSPEQALGNRDVDHRSDLWSLAVIAVECLSGKRVFESAGLGDLLLKIVAAEPPHLSSFAPELPASLQQWWARALARDPRDRFQSGRELVEALRPHVEQLQLSGSLGATSPRSAALPLRSAAAPLGERSAVSVRGGSSQRQPTDTAFHPPLQPPSPARATGSVGPTSSSRPAQPRRDQRQRTLLLAAALVAAALLITAGRLFLAGDREPASVIEATLDPAVAPPAELPAVPPVAAAPGGAAEPATPRVRIAPAEASPWDQALRNGKPSAPESATSALQPQREPPAASPRVSVAPTPASAPAEPPKPPAGSKPAPVKSAPPSAGAAPAKARAESAPPAAPSEAPGESEAARKQRLRDLVGLPKTH